MRLSGHPSAIVGQPEGIFSAPASAYNMCSDSFPQAQKCKTRGPSSGNPAHLAAALAAVAKAPNRFWSKVVKLNPSGNCWIWTSTLNQQGYGQFWVASVRRSYSAHRLAFVLSGGSVPAGLCVCHRCDNRLCVNPTHLFVATHGDNLRDMVAKGRHPETVLKSQLRLGVA